MSILKVCIASAMLLLPMAGVGAGVAKADPPGVVITPPFFYPRAEFQYGSGYHRTDDGRYYHFDRERDGWHWGRNHREGMRHEGRRNWHGRGRY